MSTVNLDYQKLVENYYKSPKVQEAFKIVDESRTELIEDWKKLASTYSPSGNEKLRAEYLVTRFKEFGCNHAYIDRTGNAVALFDSKKQGSTTVFLVTMDDLKNVAELVKSWEKPRDVREGKLIGPGTNIGSICTTGLILAKLFARGDFNGRIYVVGCTEEETGFAGTKGFLSDHPEVNYVIDIMGGYGGISYGALCIRWMKVHFKGPEAHTLEGPGPNVTKGVAKSIQRIFAIPLPPNSFLNISMLGAGTVFNHRGDDGWHSVDLRSLDQSVVDSITEEIKESAEDVARAEGLKAWLEFVVDTRGGQIPGARDSPLTRIAEESVKIFGKEPRLSSRGSCNMNAGIAAGVLSISTGGNRGGRRGYPDEYSNIDPIFTGMKLNFLIGYILGEGSMQ
jgi:acetylornithine deacetylase/succinyl-diaminopimelate desuccinylase-like protein